MVMQTVSKGLTKVFGSRNERVLKTYRQRVERINALEPEMRELTDDQLRARTAAFQQRIADGEGSGEVMPEALAVAREVMDRAVGLRNTLDPARAFDPSVLPEGPRAELERVRSEAEALEPAEVLGSPEPVPGWLRVPVPPSLYAALREALPEAKPPFRSRPFDVQLIGAMVLAEGKIAEMKTGEGKTIVAPLACYIAALEGLPSHMVTVNDYLVARDREWVFPFYHWLDLSVGAIHGQHIQSHEAKAEAYRCHVVYGTNSEFGFDYLRDNMKLAVEEQVQRKRGFCIIDEVDSILIDEARTPLIISGPANQDAPRYELADKIARHLIQKQKEWDRANQEVERVQRRIKGLEGDIRNTRDKQKAQQMREEMEELQKKLPELEAERDRFPQYYEVELDKKAAHLTEQGVAAAQEEAGIGSFYVGNNMDFPHLLENALRAHVVYEGDKDYVVQNGEVVIVDQFTGRLMPGRQWSDGLHQAVEAKERVEIKEETQTFATVTIQNFFKLYDRLAGMTGTAATEQQEFQEIYQLEVVSVPTNLPVRREDLDDLIFLSQKDKWHQIIDEIRRHHDLGRPVLVGTTSVETSEMLSQMLQERAAIPHEVLNAKQHEREAHVIENAGELGAVMIATNMAGRGTDIRLRPVDPASLIHHWQKRNLLPKEADPSMPEERIVRLAHDHLARHELGLTESELEGLDHDALRLRLLRHWVNEHGWQVQFLHPRWWKLHQFVAQPPWHDPAKVETLDAATCEAVLDRVPGFRLHRLRVFDHVEQLGGLHIVGTERHEARRIDNQLRGRSGRQGDRGSSRFFISLEDELMQMFASKALLNTLSKLGMKEGDAIEHSMVTRSVERAQRKVEERNFEIRKNLLEYDDVMEHQRNTFYTTRQRVLEGHDVRGVIFDYIRGTVDAAVGTYLDPDYVRQQIAEWASEQLEVSIDPAKLRMGDADTVAEQVRGQAEAEVRHTVEVTLGEYCSPDTPPAEWDAKGLAHWAMSRFGVDLKQNRIRSANVDELQQELTEAAVEKLNRQDLSPVAAYLEPLWPESQLAAWAEQQFNAGLEARELAAERAERNPDHQKRVAGILMAKAHEAYRQREIHYPVEFAFDLAQATAERDQSQGLAVLADWASNRFGESWTADDLAELGVEETYRRLTERQEAWLHGGELERVVDERIAAAEGDPGQLADWAAERFGVAVERRRLTEEQPRAVLVEAGQTMLRRELIQLEQFVLLQILDQAWKDHLYAMDQLKDSVGLRGYAEKDPRLEYKREGSNLFAQMQEGVQQRVTELIFRARLSPEVEQRDVYGEQQASHEDPAELAATAAGRGTDQQRADLAAADRAGEEEEPAPASRHERRAQAKTAGNAESGGGGGQNRRPSYKKRKKRKK